MASTTQERLYESFAEASGGESQGTGSSGSATEELVSALEQVVSGPNSQEGGQRTAETRTSSAASGESSGGTGSTILSVAETVLGSGLGLVPLVGELFALFGGGGASAPPVLEKYAMPESQSFEGADTGGGINAADYDDMGRPRMYSGTPNGTRMPGGREAVSAAAAGAGAGASTGTAGAPQIQVNVQTMDAQSFLDHSSDIAEAVRQAMLNLSSLNDVVSDL